MLQLENSTPFAAHLNYFKNENDIETLYTVVKASFEIKKTVNLSENQVPLFLEDEFWGEPGYSSIKYASDLHLQKPSTDLIMLGEACAPDKKMVQELDVKLSVGEKTKTVKVFGDREWVPGVVGLRKSLPIPFETMPMVYERAYGGTHIADPEKDEVLYEPKNPVGKGFLGKKRKKEIKGSALPNLEDPKNLIEKPKDTPTPACFGYVAPNWEPRLKYAGTYDNDWQSKKAPYLPDDFDPRFFNIAHPNLICDGYLKGGEPVEITNMSPEGKLKFNLPVCEMDILVHIGNKIEKPEIKLETVSFEPNKNCFTMLWRAAVECDKKVMKINKSIIELNKINYL